MHRRVPFDSKTRDHMIYAIVRGKFMSCVEEIDVTAIILLMHQHCYTCSSKHCAMEN